MPKKPVLTFERALAAVARAEAAETRVAELEVALREGIETLRVFDRNAMADRLEHVLKGQGADS